MGAVRQANMANIKAKLELEEELKQQAQDDPSYSQLSPEDAQLAAKLKNNEFKHTLEINRLRKAKSQATTKDVKDKLQQEIEAAEIRRDDERARVKAEAETITASKKTISTATHIYNDAKQQVDGVVEKGQQTISGTASWLETKAIPGSIWLPITVLLLFFFLLLPVNGKTRFTWLFEAMVGQAKISGSGETGGGSVGDFGPAPSPNGVTPPVKTFTRSADTF